MDMFNRGDLTYGGPLVQGQDDDLVQFNLSVNALQTYYNDKVELAILTAPESLRVWADRTRTSRVLPTATGYSKKWTPGSQTTPIYMEGKSPSSGYQTSDPKSRWQYWGDNSYALTGWDPDSWITVVHVDMDLAGVKDEEYSSPDPGKTEETTPGGFIPVGEFSTLTVKPVNPDYVEDVGPEAWRGVTLSVEYSGNGRVEVRDALWAPVSLPHSFSPTENVTFYVGGDQASSQLRDIKLVLTHGETGFQDKINLTVVEVDLDIAGVADGQEMTVGGFLALNDDDDNDSNTPDKDENGPVTNEDNLVEIVLQRVRPEALTGNVTLKANAGSTSVRIWEASTKGGTALTLPHSYATPSALPKSLWVEGYNASGSVRDVELALEFTLGASTLDDNVKMTVIDVQSIDVDSSGHDTYKIPSVLNASQVPDDHFVTVKGLSDDMILKATIVPDTGETRNHITWTNMTQDPSDKLKATRGRSFWGEFPVTVDVDFKNARDLTNWVVWSSGSSSPHAIQEIVTVHGSASI